MNTKLMAPFTEIEIRALKVGDVVELHGEVVLTAGLPTHQRLVDCLNEGLEPPINLRDQAFLHLGGYSEGEGSDFNMLYINPTTSTRFNPHMPTLIEGFGMRVLGGKGGLDEHCVAAMQRHGCVYLSFLGGGCTLLSRSIRKIVEVGWSDMVTHYRLTRLSVEGLGPAVVAIDANGNSLYAANAENAKENVDRVLGSGSRYEER